MNNFVTERGCIYENGSMSDETEVEYRCGEARGDDGPPPTAATRENKKRKRSKCSEPGCTRQVSRRGSCVRHGGISIKKLCTEAGCTRQSVSGGRCVRHGGMKKLCKEVGCTRKAQIGGRCHVHGGYKLCQEVGCTRQVRSGGLCGRHGGLRKLCKEAGCTRQVKSGGSCCQHGGGLRCPKCITYIDGRVGNPDYDNHCATCFKREFPEDERAKNYGFKEMMARICLEKHFPSFRHKSRLYTKEVCGCNFNRELDHHLCIGNTMICVETDERGHSGYTLEDDINRYNDVFCATGCKLVFIRFNPDGKGYTSEEKHARLIEEVREQIRRVEAEENTQLCERVFLFYPTRSKFLVDH